MLSKYAKVLEVQRKMKAIVRDEVNPHFKSQYFSINGLLSALKPVLNDVGLVVIQPLSIHDGKSTIETMVIDPDAAKEESATVLHFHFPLPECRTTQELGAAISYLRRYSLTSLFLLEGEEDDDGNSTSPSAPVARPSLNLAKQCQSCTRLYNPKPGTEAFSTLCFDCYKKSKGAPPRPVAPPLSTELDEIPY